MDIDKIKKLNFKSCLDVGANVGQFCEMIKSIDSKIYIESVEPNPWSAGKFKKRFKNVILHEVGAGSTSSVLPFYINKNKKYSKSASFVSDFNQTEVAMFEIPVKPIDDIIDKSFDLIKIDVEGYEFDVLKGAVESIKNTKYLLIEMEKNDQLIDWLRDNNFYATDILYSNVHTKNKILLDVLFEKDSADKEIIVDV